MVAAGGLWPTLVDANQLENAILNLCINARDAMPSGGAITIETGNLSGLTTGQPMSVDWTPGQYVTVCVSDTGTGIAKADLSRVFEPFFTTKPLGEGTGPSDCPWCTVSHANPTARFASTRRSGKARWSAFNLPRHLGAVIAQAADRSVNPLTTVTAKNCVDRR